MADLSEDDRRRFEAWASDDGAWPTAIERDASGQYKLSITAHSWTVWRAAIAADRALNAPQAALVGEPAAYTVDAVAWEGFITDYERYAKGDARMPFSELRLSLSAVIDSAAPVAPAEPGWMPRALMAEQMLREIAEHVSQSGDHTPESFRRGLVSLMTPTHKILRAATAPHPATAGNGQGAKATQGEPGGTRA